MLLSPRRGGSAQARHPRPNTPPSGLPTSPTTTKTRPPGPMPQPVLLIIQPATLEITAKAVGVSGHKQKSWTRRSFSGMSLRTRRTLPGEAIPWFAGACFPSQAHGKLSGKNCPPPAMQPAIPSLFDHRDHDFAARVPCPQITHRLRRLTQRVSFLDKRRHLPRLQQFLHRQQILLPGLGR